LAPHPHSLSPSDAQTAFAPITSHTHARSLPLTHTPLASLTPKAHTISKAHTTCHIHTLPLPPSHTHTLPLPPSHTHTLPLPPLPMFSLARNGGRDRRSECGGGEMAMVGDQCGGDEMAMGWGVERPPCSIAMVDVTVDADRYGTLHHTAPHCNTLQHTAIH